MAALVTKVVPLQGLRIDDLLAAAAAPLAGDDFETGAGVFLVVQNTGTAATVVLVTPEVIDGDLAVADRTISVAATTGLAIVPLTSRYRDPATGRGTLGTITGGTLKAIVVRTVV